MTGFMRIHSLQALFVQPEQAPIFREVLAAPSRHRELTDTNIVNYGLQSTVGHIF